MRRALILSALALRDLGQRSITQLNDSSYKTMN